jgi:excisionase family DNA binding protein
MYSVSEYAALLGISRQAVLKQINAGKLKARKVGKAYIILEKAPNKNEAD